MTGTRPALGTTPGTDGVPSTPGAAGYLAAVLVSWVLVTVTSGVAVLAGDWLAGESVASFDLVDVLLMGCLWAVLVGVVGVGVAPVGVGLVHVACERFDQQWIHVLVTGLVGSAAAGAVVLYLAVAWPEAFLTVVGVGLCTAVSRALVIPMVPVVQLRLPAGTPYWRRFLLT